MLYLVKKKNKKKINNLQQFSVGLSSVKHVESLKRQVRFLVLLTSAS